MKKINVFYIILNDNFFIKGDILELIDKTKVIVVMTYRNNIWRYLVNLFSNMKVSKNYLKVKIYDTSIK